MICIFVLARVTLSFFSREADSDLFRVSKPSRTNSYSSVTALLSGVFPEGEHFSFVLYTS